MGPSATRPDTTTTDRAAQKQQRYQQNPYPIQEGNA
jgi:hypothetical protein